jgi:hypothetical protein
VIGHTPTPLILDSTVVRELARGEIGTIELMQGYDAGGQPMVVPALTITHAIRDTPTEDAVDLLHGLAELEQVTVASLHDAEQATTLAMVMNVTGLAVWDAHVAAVADASVCPILTYDAARWQEPSRALEERLFVIEIPDPEVDG